MGDRAPRRAPHPPDPQRFRSERPVTGTPAQVADTIHRFAGMGATSLELILLPATDDTLDQAVEALALLE
ncbi:MAG: hypothetical protein R3246_10115 [Acidimicrobiia bacterium]|nr:hypothetical protein [Acidimicrobiia bacterium]